MTVSIFNQLRHGDIEDLDDLLDSRDLTNAQLRAILQNMIEDIVRLRHAVVSLERRVGDEQ